MDEIANDDPPSGRCRNVLSGDTVRLGKGVPCCPLLFSHSGPAGFIGVGHFPGDRMPGFVCHCQDTDRRKPTDGRGVYLG